MNPTTFGVPNTLPPLSRRDLRGCLFFGGMGLFVLLLGLFPSLLPAPRLALPLASCGLALPAWGLFRYFTRRTRNDGNKPAERTHGTSTQVQLYTVIMVGVGVGFFLCARHLGASSSVILGTLLLIEGLGGMIVSLTGWWRFSHVGISSGLMAGGFLVPFVEQTSIAVPVGAAFLLGSLLSAGILYWQLCQTR